MSSDKNPLKPVSNLIPIRREPFKPQCLTCSDTGAIAAYRKDMPGTAPFAFSCVCERAVQAGRPYPRWSALNEALYTREPVLNRGTT